MRPKALQVRDDGVVRSWQVLRIGRHRGWLIRVEFFLGLKSDALRHPPGGTVRTL